MEENDISRYPPKPEEPLDSECCGTGCSPCVFDIYKRQLTQWEQECRRIKSNQLSASIPSQLLDPVLHLNPENYLQFKIIKVVPDTPKSKIFRFSLISSAMAAVPACFPFSTSSFALGQHVVLRIGAFAKPYTVLDHGEEDSQPYFDLLVKVYVKGQLTPLISNLSPGNQVEFRGLFGKPYQYQPNCRSTIYMLAAGTGIAPMSRVIETITSNEDDETRIKLIFCNRTVASILIKPTLKRWAEFWNFHAVHYLSKTSAAVEPVPYGMNVKFKRFTKLDFLEECKEDSTVFYLVCGSKSFTKDILNYLKNAGVSEERFHVF